jgi:hypothetical protein
MKIKKEYIIPTANPISTVEDEIHILNNPDNSNIIIDENYFDLIESHISHFKINDFNIKDKNVIISLFGKISNCRYICTFTCDKINFPFIEDTNTLLTCLKESMNDENNFKFSVNQFEKCFQLIHEIQIMSGKTKKFILKGKLQKLKDSPENEITRLSIMLEDMMKRVEVLESTTCIIGEYIPLIFLNNNIDVSYTLNNAPIIAPINTKEIHFIMTRCSRNAYNIYRLNIISSDNSIHSYKFNTLCQIKSGFKKLRYLKSINFSISKEYKKYFRQQENLKNEINDFCSNLLELNPNITEFYSEFYESSNLQGYNLSLLFNLEHLTLRSSTLENVSNYLQLFPKLNYLDVNECPKLFANDKAKLESECKKKKIILSI